MAKSVNDSLLKLQDAIAEYYAIEKKKSSIPLAIQEKKETLEYSKSKHNDLLNQSKRYKEYIEKDQKSLEEIRTKRFNAEAKIEKVATQREFDAENEILEKCRLDEHRISENSQKLKKKIEQLADRIKESEELVKALSATTEVEIKELEFGIAGVENELRVAREKKEKLSQGVSPELLFKFERIIKNKGGIGKVALKAGVCQGCHMELPQQFVNKVRLNEEIEFCPYCSRILNYEEADEDMEILESDTKYYSERADEKEDDMMTSEIDEINEDITRDEDIDPIEARAANFIADESEFDL